MKKEAKIKIQKKPAAGKIPWENASKIKGATLIGHVFIKEHFLYGDSGHFIYLVSDNHPAVGSIVSAEVWWAVIAKPSFVEMPKGLNWRKSFVPVSTQMKARK